MTDPAASQPPLDGPLPGRPGRGWAAAALAAALLVAWGLYAYSVQLEQGLIATALRTIGRGGAAWGLYVAFDIYFVGISFAGISTAALVRLFPLDPLRPLTRLAELITIVALLMGGLSILADLGRPLRGLLYLPMYGRPSSPFFGTFTLVVAGYLFASLVYFFLAGRADAALCARVATPFRRFHRLWASGYAGSRAEIERHRRVSFWLSLTILPLLVAAHSTLGFVFGIQAGRPGWFSALQAPGFVVLAGASGLAMLTIAAAICRRAMGLEAQIGLPAFRILANFQWILTLVYLYFMGVEELTASYAATAADEHVAHAVVRGPYSPVFWLGLLCLAAPTAILFIQFVRGTTSIGWAVASAVMINVGAVLKRMLIVVPSQTHGMLLPYPTGHYSPNWVELSIICSLFALAVLAILLFVRIFPIVPVAGEEGFAPAGPAAPETPGAARRRVATASAVLLTGTALAAVGLLSSFRVGTLPYLDPVVPLSPALFIAGVMLMFGSAIVYEIHPRPAAGSAR